MTTTTQREADERAIESIASNHDAMIILTQSYPREAVIRVVDAHTARQVRAAIDQDTRQAAPEALALTEAETRLMARLRAASGSGAAPWVDLLTEIDDPHMVDFDELTMLARILERTIRQAAPEAPAAPAVNIGGCPFCGKSGNCTENCSAATDQPSTGQADERAEFERMYAELNHSTPGGGWSDFDTATGRYHEEDTHDAWVFWQKARASLTLTAPQAATTASASDPRDLEGALKMVSRSRDILAAALTNVQAERDELRAALARAPMSAPAGAPAIKPAPGADEESCARRLKNFSVRAEPAREPDFVGEKSILVTYNGRQEYTTALAPHEARRLYDLLAVEYSFAAPVQAVDVARDAERYQFIEEHATMHGGGNGFTITCFVGADEEDMGVGIDKMIAASLAGKDKP